MIFPWGLVENGIAFTGVADFNGRFLDGNYHGTAGNLVPKAI